MDVANIWADRTWTIFNLVDYLYQSDPQYIRPLDFDLKMRLDPKKNPFFEHGEGVMMLARKNGRVVGRMTAQIDREHLRVWRDGTGFFGFFDTIVDAAVGRALLGRRTGEKVTVSVPAGDLVYTIVAIS